MKTVVFVRSLICGLILVCGTQNLSGQTIQDAIGTLRSAGLQTDSGQIREALQTVTDQGPKALLPVLQAFDEASLLATNYLRNAFETIADAELAAGRALPKQRLVDFIKDTSESAAARRLAYEWLLKQNPELEQQLIPGMLQDPSAEFRRDAVARLLEQAKAAEDPAQATEFYRQALQGAVHPDQVRTIAQALRKAGEDVNLQQHFGFLSDWMIIGPFDNKDMQGFPVAYPPEQEVDLSATYQGQLGEVSWQPISTDDDYGKVDIGKQLQNFKGSAMYATTTFHSDQEQLVQFRLGTPNAWKLWVNGELVFQREEYHRSTRMDQYKVPVRLQAGANTILLKVLQNEQDQDWAQDYHYQLRVSDAAGSAILSQQ